MALIHHRSQSDTQVLSSVRTDEKWGFNSPHPKSENEDF